MSDGTGIDYCDASWPVVAGCTRLSPACESRRGARPLERNINWKGGRTIASNGYVLIKCPGHPMADCRGYVYEHRLIAAQTLGRPLMPGEQVHHKDGNPLNNAPENIVVEPTLHHHRVQHRKRANLRMPGETNPVVECACGCGLQLARYDGSGRPRRFAPHHNLRIRDSRGHAIRSTGD